MQLETLGRRFEYPDFQFRMGCREVDEAFTGDIDLLKGLFDRYSGAFDLPTEKANMSLAEFEALMRASNLLDAGYNEKFVRLAYTYAIPMSQDETKSLDHMRMMFPGQSVGQSGGWSGGRSGGWSGRRSGGLMVYWFMHPLPPTAHRPPPTAHRPPPTAHRPLPTTHQTLS